MHDLIERHADAMHEGALIVVTRGLVRLRSARNKIGVKTDGTCVQSCTLRQEVHEGRSFNPGRVRHCFLNRTTREYRARGLPRPCPVLFAHMLSRVP